MGIFSMVLLVSGMLLILSFIGFSIFYSTHEEHDTNTLHKADALLLILIMCVFFHTVVMAGFGYFVAIQEVLQ